MDHATESHQRDAVVGTYEASKFPKYAMAADGYPVSTDCRLQDADRLRANADRYETWLANPTPTQDSQQPFVGTGPQSGYPANPSVRNAGSCFPGHDRVPGDQAVHAATDVPPSVYRRARPRSPA